MDFLCPAATTSISFSLETPRPVVIASNIIISLQQIVSRNAHFNIPTVLSFGRFIADGVYNVIPDTVELKGTFRTFNEHWRAEAHVKIKEKADGSDPMVEDARRRLGSL